MNGSIGDSVGHLDSSFLHGALDTDTLVGNGDTNSMHKYKYTNTQIHKYTNTQILIGNFNVRERGRNEILFCIHNTLQKRGVHWHRTTQNNSSKGRVE